MNQTSESTPCSQAPAAAAAPSFDQDMAATLRRVAAALERLAAGVEGRLAFDRAAGRPKTISSIAAVASDLLELSDVGAPPEGEADATPSTEENPLHAFLAQRQIAIKKVPPPDEADDVLDRLSVFIGSRFAGARKLIDAIKRNLNDGGPFQLNLRDERQEHGSNICQLATMLHEIAFLTDYRYEKAPARRVFARPSRFPKAINFFTGGWLERYVRCRTRSAFQWSRPGQKVWTLAGAQVVLPNGDDFEIDLLAASGDDVFWFEAKTGEYQQHVAKYSKLAKLMGLGRNRSIMVLVEATPNNAAAISNLFNMTVAPVDGLDAWLEASLGPPPESPDGATDALEDMPGDATGDMPGDGAPG